MTKSNTSPSAATIGESDQRLRFALEAGQMGFWEIELPSWELTVTATHMAGFGLKPDDPWSFDLLLAAIHPEDQKAVQAAIRQTLETGAPIDIEYRTIWPDGSVHWQAVRGKLAYDIHGQPARMAGISFDITIRRQIEQSLLEETRSLETLNGICVKLSSRLDLDAIASMVTAAGADLTGAEFGAFFFNRVDGSKASDLLYGVSKRKEDILSGFPIIKVDAAGLPAFYALEIAKWDDISQHPDIANYDPHITALKAHFPIASTLSVPILARAGDIIGGLIFGHEQASRFDDRAMRLAASIAAQAGSAIDNARLFQAAQDEIAERRRVEERQRLLLAELNHRVRNTLAIVQSIAGQTLRHSDSAESFRTGFESRIMALAEAHGLLTDSNWEGASVRDIAQRVLNPHSSGGHPRFRLEYSSDVRLGPSPSVSLVLALHELATNAAKYGALSNAKGVVHLSWKMMEATHPPHLQLRWEEIGGPKIAPPSRRGFGSRLIQSLAADTGGKAQIEYRETGLVCVFDLPFPAGVHADSTNPALRRASS